jgi:hypothetical protein
MKKPRFVIVHRKPSASQRHPADLTRAERTMARALVRQGFAKISICCGVGGSRFLLAYDHREGNLPVTVPLKPGKPWG